jgi:hypothetical protein
MTPAQRSMRAKIAYLEGQARGDGPRRSAGPLARFLRQVDFLEEGLPDRERHRRAEAMLRAHMLTLAAKSAKARRKSSDRTIPVVEAAVPEFDRTATPQLQAYYLRTYRMTVEDYGLMLAEQGGTCRLCPAEPSPKRRHHVDHDHRCCPGATSCGRCVRGVLCGSCNLAVAGYERFRDSLAIDDYVDTRRDIDAA